MGMFTIKTGSATDGNEYITIIDDTTTNAAWTSPPSTKYKVQKSITAKQKKMIKEEIKVWMDDHLKKSIEKEAGNLLKDIEYLKAEKARLGKGISALKQELRNTKKDIQAEMKAMEETLENYANNILRFQNMDL